MDSDTDCLHEIFLNLVLIQELIGKFQELSGIKGKTLDGKYLVLDGEMAFELVATHGVPLEIVLTDFEENGFIICWISFYKKAKLEGWNSKTILSKIFVAHEDVFGYDFAVDSNIKLLETFKIVDNMNV